MENKVAIITGSRRGLGKETAYMFASKGYDIVINDKEDQEKIKEVVNEIETKYKVRVLGICIDYDASKAGIISLTNNFALEYQPKILVNAVAPGWINTEMNKQLEEEVIKEETEKIYLKRFAEPKEVATLIYFLCSEENTYVNGETIKIDGGY